MDGEAGELTGTVCFGWQNFTTALLIKQLGGKKNRKKFRGCVKQGIYQKIEKKQKNGGALWGQFEYKIAVKPQAVYRGRLWKKERGENNLAEGHDLKKIPCGTLKASKRYLAESRKGQNSTLQKGKTVKKAACRK